MAEFTGDLSDPNAVGNAYGFMPQGGSGDTAGGIIGHALSGAADIGALAMKRMDLEKRAGVQQQVGNQLFDLVNGSKSDSTVKDTSGQLNKLQSANSQGKMSREELLTRSSAIIQQAVNQNPYYADEIRSLGQTVLGFQPTAEQAGLVIDQAKWEDQTRRAATAGAVEKATAAGIQYHNPDGTVDIDRTASAGLQVSAAEHELSMKDQQAALNLKEIDIAKAGLPQPLTEDERKAQTNIGIQQTLNPVFEKNFGSFLARVPTMMASVKGQSEEQQRSAIMVQVNTAKAQWHQYVAGLFGKMKNPPSQSDQDTYLKNADDRFDSLASLAQGPMSAFEGNVRAVKDLQNKTTIQMSKDQPKLFKLKTIFGDNVFSSAIGVAIGQDHAAQGQIDQEVSNVVGTPHVPSATEAASLAADLGAGKVHLDDLPNDGYRAKVIPYLKAATDVYYRDPAHMTDVEQSAYGHTIANVASVGARLTSRDDVMGASQMTNSSAAVQAFKTFAANPKNAQNVHATAEELLKLNNHNLQMNVPRLVQGGDIAVHTAKYIQGQGTPYDHATVHYSAYYNPQTGQIEPVVTAKTNDGRNVPVPPEASRTGELKEHLQNIAEMNKSLTAGTQYKNFSLGRMKEWTDQQYRYGAVAAWGLPVKPGTMPPHVPNETREVSLNDAKSFIKTKFGVDITSGHRSAADNEKAGGAKDSLHMSDGAVDFEAPGYTKDQIRVELANAGLPITELLDHNDEARLHVGHMGPHTFHWGFGKKTRTASE